MKLDFLISTLNFLGPVIILVLSHLVYRFTKYLDTKVKNQQTREILSLLDNIALDVVKSVHQTYVSGQRVDNQPLEKEIAAKAKELAVDQVKQHLGPENLTEVQKNLKVDNAGIDHIISTKVEAAVFNLKGVALPAILLAFFLPFAGCVKKPTTVATTTITTQQKVITTADEGVATWYTIKANDCMSKAIVVRDQLRIGGLEQHATPEQAETVARREAKVEYDKCMDVPEKVALKIADVVDLARKENKVAAQVVLDVIRGNSPITVLGNSSSKVIDLIVEIEKIVADNNIKL